MLPDAIVGDGDSLPQQFKDRYKDIIHYVAEQDYNDLTKATRFFLEHYRSPSTKHPRICYIGCTGKREDHTLGNISLPTFYRQEFGVEGCCLPTSDGLSIVMAHASSRVFRTNRSASSISIAPP